MRPLLIISPQDMAAGYGIYPGPPKVSVPLWQEGNNVAFGEGGFRRIDGASRIRGSTVHEIREIEQAFVPSDSGDEQRIYVASDLEVFKFAWKNEAWVANQQIWVFPNPTKIQDLETWGSWVVGTDGLDRPFVWKNTTFPGSYMIDVPFDKVKVLKRKHSMLLAMNTDNIGSTGIEWNDPRGLETETYWTPSAENRAGNFNLRDFSSEIVAAHDLGDSVAIYSRNEMAVGNFVGGTAVWSFKKRADNIGAISRRSVVPVGPVNYGLTEHGIWMTDGVNAGYLPDDPVLTWLKANIYQPDLWKVWGFHDDTARCVTWYFPTAVGWRSVSYHLINKVFTKGNLQYSAGAPKGVWPQPIIADPYFVAALYDVQLTDFVDVTWSLKSKPLDFGNNDYKYLLGVRALGVFHATTQLTIRAHDFPEDVGTIVWNQALTRDNYPRYEGRMFSFEFSGTKPAKIAQLEFYGAPGSKGF